MKTSMPRWITLIVIAATAMGCAHRSYNLSPASRLMEPGPGVGGPGPGVLSPQPAPVFPAGATIDGPVGVAMAAPYAMPVGNYGYGMVAVPPANVQILFARPESMRISWDVSGVGYFDSEPLIVPGRQTFPTGGIFRLKVANIEGREGVERYPTLEVGPVTPRTEAYLAHNAIPIQLTDEDFDQVDAGNFVTKVIYLPDPEFQELALAGVETLVSTRLDPGIDPIVEADRRGAILAIVRMGNKDLAVQGMNGAFNGMGGAGVMPTGANLGAGACGNAASPGVVVPYGNVPNYLSGVTVPQYGMPISGTPIGLPGPPHIPLGTPAGLMRHTIRNHTPMDIPQPVRHFSIDVRQQPGYSYPKPPHRMRVVEQSIQPPIRFGQPHNVAKQHIE